MALPKIDKLSNEPTVSENDSKAVQQEILKLGQSIQKSSSVGLQAATQAVVGNVPEMIRDLTDDIKSGSINNFATAMNKLISLTEDLGINLRDYNAELADTVDRFTGNQAKLQEELGKLREQGIKAEIDENGKRVRLLTQNDIIEYNKQREVNNQSIENNRSEIEQKTKLLNLTDEELKLKNTSRKDTEKSIKANAIALEGLEEENKLIEQKTGTTADTGRGGDQGFGKFQELKEAFMIIPDTIGEAMTSFSKAGKGVFTGLTSLFTKGGLAKAFKGLVNFFKTARIMIAGVFLAVVAAIQFIAEHIDGIADFFIKIWNKITGFFKAIGEWFSNSWLGKKLGLGKAEADEDEKVSNMKAKSYDQMDDGTYAIGNDGAEIKDNNVDEFLAQSKDASNAPAVDFDGQIYQPGEDGYEQAKANRTQDTQSYLSDEVNENSKAMSIKDIIGDNAGGQLKTSSMLKGLESESNNIKPPTVINVQNNATSNTSQSASTNVSGFLDHHEEPTLKFVKQGSTGSADF